MLDIGGIVSVIPGPKMSALMASIGHRTAFKNAQDPFHILDNKRGLDMKDVKPFKRENNRLIYNINQI